ncbi:hypothetical protein DPMN_037420 [Dreissena polymorpha]|uniref:CCHC-type domain-containing protein n=1 Tax=Dreissena polymorpha TaxID=45954 RepID=A0A9D4MCN6_DREPO|nr:hypothetical protein DPMN_037420 [Dreissena polymorpha]
MWPWFPMIPPGWIQSPTNTNNEVSQPVSSGQRVSEPNYTANSTAAGRNSSSRFGLVNNFNSRPLGQLQRSLSYDGQSNWQKFYTKFDRYATLNDWDPQKMKEYLCLSLTGKASEFYALVTDKQDNLSFVNIVEKLERRYGDKELPETAMIKFSNATQTHDETIDDWADRVLTLATKAFRHLPDNYMNEQVVLRLCLGLNDKEAGESVVNMRPKSIEEAFDKVKWAVHTHGLMFGRSKSISKNTSEECFKVQSVGNENPKESRIDKLEMRMDRMEQKMDKIEQKLDKIMDKLFIISMRKERSQSPISRVVQLNLFVILATDADICQENVLTPVRSRSPSPRRSLSPSKPKCFNCNQEGHFQADCPKFKQKPSKVKKFEFEYLNSSGSELEGKLLTQE